MRRRLRSSIKAGEAACAGAVLAARVRHFSWGPFCPSNTKRVHCVIYRSVPRSITCDVLGNTLGKELGHRGLSWFLLLTSYESLGSINCAKQCAKRFMGLFSFNSNS